MHGSSTGILTMPCDKTSPLCGGCHVLFPQNRRVSSVCRPEVCSHHNADTGFESNNSSGQFESQFCSNDSQSDIVVAIKHSDIVSEAAISCPFTHNLDAGSSVQQCAKIDESTCLPDVESLQKGSSAPCSSSVDSFNVKADAHAESKLAEDNVIETAACQLNIERMLLNFPEDKSIKSIRLLCEHSKSLVNGKANMVLNNDQYAGAFNFLCIHIPICRTCTEQYVARKNVFSCFKPIQCKGQISEVISKNILKQLHSECMLSADFNISNLENPEAVCQDTLLNGNSSSCDLFISELSLSNPSFIEDASLPLFSIGSLEHEQVLPTPSTVMIFQTLQNCTEEESSVIFTSCLESEVVFNGDRFSVDNSDSDNHFTLEFPFCDSQFEDNDVRQCDKNNLLDYNNTVFTPNPTAVKSAQFSNDVFLAGEAEYFDSSDDNICLSRASSSADLFHCIQSSPDCNSPLKLKRIKKLKQSNLVRSRFTHTRSLRQSPRTAAIKSKQARNSVMDDASWSYFKKSLSALALEQSNTPIAKTATDLECDSVESNLLAFAGALELLPVSSSIIASYNCSLTPVCHDNLCSSLRLPCCCSPIMSCENAIASIQRANSFNSLDAVANPNSPNSLLRESTLSSNSVHLTNITSYITDFLVVSLPVIVSEAANGCLHEYSSSGGHCTYPSIILPAPVARSSRKNCQGDMDYEDEDFKVTFQGDCFNLGGEENFEPDYDFLDEDKVNDPQREIAIAAAERRPVSLLPDEGSKLTVCVGDVRTVSLRSANVSECNEGIEHVDCGDSIASNKKIELRRPGTLSTTSMPRRGKRHWRQFGTGSNLSALLIADSSSNKCRPSSSASVVHSHMKGLAAFYAEPEMADDQFQFQFSALVGDELTNKAADAGPTVSMEDVLADKSAAIALVEEALSVAGNDGTAEADEEFLEGDWSPTEDDMFWEDEEDNKLTANQSEVVAVDNTYSKQCDQQVSSGSTHTSATIKRSSSGDCSNMFLEEDTKKCTGKLTEDVPVDSADSKQFDQQVSSGSTNSAVTIKRSHTGSSNQHVPELNSAVSVKQSTSSSRASLPKRPKITSLAPNPLLGSSYASSKADTVTTKGILKSVGPRQVEHSTEKKNISKSNLKTTAESKRHGAVKPVMSNTACLIKSCNALQDIGKLCQLMLRQQDSYEDKWDKAAIECFIDAFAADSEFTMLKKYQDFVRRLSKTSYHQDDQKHCVLFLGVHLMHCCVQQYQWETAFYILKDMVEKEVQIHKLVSNSVQDTESVGEAVQVCCKMNKYDTLGLMLKTLKYFKDPRPHTTRKQAQMVSIVLAALVKEVPATSKKLQLCQIGYTLTEVILDNCDQDPEIRKAVEDGVIDLTSVSVFMLACTDSNNPDLLLKFCEFHSERPSLMKWMPESLPKLISFLGRSNSLFEEAVRLAKVAADLKVYPILDSTERLVLSNSMSKEEISAYLVAFLKEVGFLLHAAEKKLACPLNFCVLLGSHSNSNIEQLACRFEAALAATILKNRQCIFRRIGNRYRVEISDLSCVLTQVLPSVFSSNFLAPCNLNLRRQSIDNGVDTVSSEIKHTQSFGDKTGHTSTSASFEIAQTQISVHTAGRQLSNMKPLLSTISTASPEIKQIQTSVPTAVRQPSDVKQLLSKDDLRSSFLGLPKPPENNTGTPNQVSKSVGSSVAKVRRPLLPTPSEESPGLSSKTMTPFESANEQQRCQLKGTFSQLPKTALLPHPSVMPSMGSLVNTSPIGLQPSVTQLKPTQAHQVSSPQTFGCWMQKPTDTANYTPAQQSTRVASQTFGMKSAEIAIANQENIKDAEKLIAPTLSSQHSTDSSDQHLISSHNTEVPQKQLAIVTNQWNMEQVTDQMTVQTHRSKQMTNSDHIDNKLIAPPVLRPVEYSVANDNYQRDRSSEQSMSMSRGQQPTFRGPTPVQHQVQEQFESRAQQPTYRGTTPVQHQVQQQIESRAQRPTFRGPTPVQHQVQQQTELRAQQPNYRGPTPVQHQEQSESRAQQPTYRGPTPVQHQVQQQTESRAQQPNYRGPTPVRHQMQQQIESRAQQSTYRGPTPVQHQVQQQTESRAQQPNYRGPTPVQHQVQQQTESRAQQPTYRGPTPVQHQVQQKTESRAQQPTYRGPTPVQHQVQQQTESRAQQPNYRGPTPVQHQVQQQTGSCAQQPTFRGPAPVQHQVQQKTESRAQQPTYRGPAPVQHQVQQQTGSCAQQPTFRGPAPVQHQVQQKTESCAQQPTYRGPTPVQHQVQQKTESCAQQPTYRGPTPVQHQVQQQTESCAQQPTFRGPAPVQHQVQRQSESRAQQPASKMHQNTQPYLPMQPDPAVSRPHAPIQMQQSPAMQLRPHTLPKIEPLQQRLPIPRQQVLQKAQLQQQGLEVLQQQKTTQNQQSKKLTPYYWVESSNAAYEQPQETASFSCRQGEHFTQQHSEQIAQQAKQQIIMAPSNFQQMPSGPQLHETGVAVNLQRDVLSSRAGTLQQQVSPSQHVKVSTQQPHDLRGSVSQWTSQHEASESSYPIAQSYISLESQGKTSTEQCVYPFGQQEFAKEQSFTKTVIQSRGLAPRQLRPQSNSPQTFEPKLPKYSMMGTVPGGIPLSTSSFPSSAWSFESQKPAPAVTLISQVTAKSTGFLSGQDTDRGQLNYAQPSFQPEFQVFKRDTASSFFQKPVKFSNPLDSAKSVATVSSQQPSASVNYQAQPPMMQAIGGQYNCSLPTVEHCGNQLPFYSITKPPPDFNVVRPTSSSYKKDPVFISPATRQSSGNEFSMKSHQAVSLQQSIASTPESTQAAKKQNRVYRTIADHILERLNEQLLQGDTLPMNDDVKEGFVSFLARNFHDQQKRQSGSVVLSEETFTELDNYIYVQIELRQSTQSAKIQNRVYRTIADHVLERVTEHILQGGTPRMNDNVKEEEFVSSLTRNFYEHQKRQSGSVVLSDETFVELDEYVDVQIELRHQHS